MTGQVVLWGGTGQAQVVARMMHDNGLSVACVCDSDRAVPRLWPDVPLFNCEETFSPWLEDQDVEHLSFVAAIGGTGGHHRLAVSRYLTGFGLTSLTLVHRAAFVDSSVSLGPGVQVLAAAVVSVGAVVGGQCIVNTNATVDHGCVLGDGVHVMPSAAVAGLVKVGDLASIGTNATVLPRLKIGVGAVVGAGAVVTRDVAAWTTVSGVPARPVGLREPPVDGSASPWITGARCG